MSVVVLLFFPMSTKVIVVAVVTFSVGIVSGFIGAMVRHIIYNKKMVNEHKEDMLLVLPKDLRELKIKIEQINKEGIDIVNDKDYKKLNNLIDLLIEYHSDKRVKKGEATDEKGNKIDYWDKQACDIFKKNVLEYAKQQRDIISKSNTKGTELKIGENFFPMDNTILKGSVSEEEFFQRIIKENMIQLPKLPEGDTYVYDVPSHTLMIKTKR